MSQTGQLVHIKLECPCRGASHELEQLIRHLELQYQVTLVEELNPMIGNRCATVALCLVKKEPS